MPPKRLPTSHRSGSQDACIENWGSCAPLCSPAALGGTAVVATRHLAARLDPLTLAFCATALAGLCLGAAFFGYRLPWIQPRDVLPVILLGTLLFAGFPALFNQALAWTTAARGALALATMPLLTLLLAGDATCRAVERAQAGGRPAGAGRRVAGSRHARPPPRRAPGGAIS